MRERQPRNRPLPTELITGMLERGISDAIAVHGACTQAALDFFVTGVVRRSGPDIPHPGRIYLMPLIFDQDFKELLRERMARYVVEHPTRLMRDMDQEMRRKLDSGSHIEMSEYDALMPSAHWSITKAMAYAADSESEFDYRMLLQTHGVPYGRISRYAPEVDRPQDIPIPADLGLAQSTAREIQAFLYNSQKENPYNMQRGVLIAAGRKLMKLGIEIDPEESESIVVRTSGLTAEYVSGIVPLGRESNEAIMRYLASRR